MLEKAHKGFNRHEPGVAGPGAVVSGRFQMLQKVQHEGRIELLQTEGRWGDPQARARKLQEELKGVGIAVAGMGTRAPLQRQALTEKGGEMGGERCHGVASLIKRSHAWAISSISWGERSKYQKVLLTWA